MADERPRIFGWNRSLSRTAFARAGLLLMAVKYGVDLLIARATGHA